jgi:hypothetical protein
MLRNLNVISARGRATLGTPFVGKTAAQLASAGTSPGLLANDVLAGDPVGCLYRTYSDAWPTVGNFDIGEDGGFALTGAPDGTYTGPEVVTKYDPAVGLFSTESTTYSFTIGAPTTPPADTTVPTFAAGAVITLSAITSSGAHATLPAATDNVAVAGYQLSVDTGTAAWSDVGNVLALDISNKAAATDYTVRWRAFDGATPRNYSAAITAPLRTAAAVVVPGTPITVPASRTAKFAGRQRVAVFSTPAPVTLAKGALDELWYVGDFTKDATDAGTTAVSVDPVPGGAAVLVAPQLQGSLGVVKLGALDASVAAPCFTFRVTLANGEQVDRTIKFTVLDDRTHVFGKDPDDKRFWALDFSADAALGAATLASVQAPVVAGVTSLATPTINGNTAIVKLGGLDVAGGANSCSLTAMLANGEKLVNTIYFNREDH